MDNLASRLKDVNEAGVYRLNCALSDVRTTAWQDGFAVFDADLSGVHGKGEFLAVLAQAIHAPDWFGHNWDALADALGDLSWQPAAGYVLVLQNGGASLGLCDEEFEDATEILNDTVRFWKSRNTPFWVFFCETLH